MGTHARNVTFYNPRVSIFYGQSIDNDTIGCVSQTVCSTDTFSSNRNLQCSFTPTMGNQNISRFYAKVCDIGDGQNGRCSIFRNIDVFVNKPPVANITMQYYDASGVAQGNNLSENAQGIINVTHNQSLYCNVDIDTQGNHDSWSTGQDFNVSWYLKMNGVFELCPPNSLSCPVDQDLPSGLLVPGDEWICSATPYNDFIIGQEVNSSIIKVTGVTGDGAQGFETPVLHTVSPPQQNVIKGNDAQITIRYSNIFEDPLRVYVCDYNETPAFFRPSGCIIITEYNRTFTPINPAQNQSFTFNISTEKLKSNNNNLSVVTCTTTNCSTPQHFNVTMQNPIQPNITNWTIQNYTSASDTQTIYPINGIYLINDTDTVFVNYTKNNDTKNVLIQWYIHISDEFVACPFDNPACPVGAFLPSTITMPGQQWFASLTPVNGSYVGPTVNTSIITIKDREVTINASVLGVTSTSQSVMRGEDITVDISFSSFTDNRLRLYICAYNDTTAYYTTSGCIIIHEYYRNITPFVIDPSVTQTYQATFSSATLSTGQNNLTVVLCNEQSCTPQTNNSIHKPQFSVQVNQTLNITYIGLRNNSDSNKAYFDNNRTYLDVPNNLFCNVNFTDVQDNLYANHPTNNISDFTNTQGSLTYRWFYLQNNVFVPFVNNNAVLSNSVIQQIGVTEWKCEVEITETNKPSVTKSSQTVSILQSSSSNDISPEILDITHNAHTHRNENELTTFQIMWRHNDTSITNVTLFICERGLIFPSGCENNELYRTVLTRPASGLTSIVQAPIFSQNENIDLNISIFDKNLQYDFNDTHNVKINNRPTAQNVKTQLNNNILTCTYLYDGNKRTQHIGGHGVESSQNRQVQWYKDGQLLTTQQSNLLSPQGNGIYYCAVKVADVYGLSDDEFVFSNNAQFVGQQSSGLHIYNTYRFVKTNTYNIIGYIDQPDINITAFVYNASDNLQVERNHSNGTSAPLSVLVGTTQSLSSWSIEAQQITLPLSANSLINSSNTGENPRWVEFSNHNRTDGQRYNMTWNTAQNNNIIVNITPPLEHPITSQTEIRIYNESNKTGWFNITVELTQGENNIDVRVNTTPQTWFTVFSRDLPLVFDNTSPEVHITEQWLSTQTRTITAIMNDTIGLDKSSLIFNVSGDVIANNLLQCTEQTLNGLLKNLTCSYSVTNSSGVDINVSISDMAGNVASGNITSQYNPNPPATVQNIKTKDTISQNDTIIRNPFNISWDSVDDILHYRVQIVSYPLTQVLYERNTTHNHTLIQNMSLFVPDNQYQVLVSAVSRYNVEGDQNASSDFTYKTPSIIPLQLLNISGNNQSFVKNNVTYYINNNSSTTSALYFNTSRQNLTCYMTQQRMSVADATSSPQAISQKGNSSNDYTITFTLSHVNQGKKERYIICDYNGLPQEVDEALHIQWYVDTQKPTIQIHSPANKSVVSNPFVLNYTASDLHSGLKNSTVYAVDLFDDTQKTIITNMTIPKISNISRYHIVSYDYVGNTQTKQVWYRKQGTEPLIITDMPTYFNNAINATLIVANANSVSYNIVRNSNGHEEDTESPTIPNNLLIHPINIDTSSYANEIFTFTVTAGNKVYEQLLIKDAIAPTVADTSQPTSMINRTDNLVFTANITENEALKEVYLNITLYNSSNTPMYQNISKLPAIIHDANAKQTNATVHIPSAWLKSITKNWTNNYTIEWQWVAKDQANNMNTTPKQNITVVNRPAYLNITKNISWSFAHTGIQSGATLNLAPYIVNPDGNQLSITHAVLGGQLLRSITNNQLRISGNPGTYQLNITLQDNFGGINTTTLNITITNTQPSCNQASNYILIPSNSCVGTSSSPHDEHHDNTPPQRTGGGGGSIGSTTVLRQTIALANPQQPIDMPIYNTQIPISHIFAQLSKEVRSINMIITPGKPFDVPTPIGYTVHAYARIQHNPLSNTDVTQALITFRVPKHVQQPIILRYTTTWNELPTRLISSDAQFNYYQATSPGLSVFAIATKQQTPPSSPLTGNIVAPPPQPTCYDGIQNQGEQGIDCGGPCAPCETPTIPTQPSTETQHTPLPPQSSWLTWILMAGVLVVVLSGTVGTYVVMQKPKPPELYPISPGMSSIEIYIRKELNKGFSEPHITDALLGIGWKQQTIQEEFDRILGRESHKKLDVEPVQNKPKDVLQEFVATQFFTKSLGVQDAIAQQPWTEHDKQYAQAFLEALQDLAQQVHMWKVKGYTQQMIKDHLLQLEWPLYIIYEMLKR
ncbi:MAG: PGF-pre-PGF domain-containing protein [Candidatus Woesearchaeota archaeon]